MQYVLNENFESEKLRVLCGVPQGSVIGPILYLIYVNDIESLDLFGLSYLFADDTCLVYSASDISVILDNMQKDIKLLDIWFRSNKLTVNIKKKKKLYDIQ